LTKGLNSKTVIPPLKPLKKDDPKQILCEQQEVNIDDSKDNITIKDLKLEDKEKVLRILFAKMNGVTLENEPDRSKKSKLELRQQMKHRSGFNEVTYPFESTMQSAGIEQYMTEGNLAVN
jgi:hypothetical protein